MMYPSDTLDREIDSLERDLDEGLISRDEYNQQVIELEREHAEMAREAAWDAYDQELEQW